MWSVASDGTDRRLLFVDSTCTGNLPERISFAWSPRGDRVAWITSNEEGGFGEIAVRDLRSGRVRLITHARKPIEEVAWTSRDEIVFSSNRTGATNLWVMRSEGGPAAELTRGAGPDLGIQVSEDARTLLYMQQHRTGSLWVASVSGGPARCVAHELPGPRYPRVSPNGNGVAVSIGSPDVLDPASHLYVLDLAGGIRRQVSFGDECVGYSDWSPDGRHIAYAATPIDAPADSASWVYVLDLMGGGGTRRLRRGFGVMWLSDSTLLTVEPRRKSTLVSVPDNTVLAESEDSTVAYPARGGGSLVADFHRAAMAFYWQPPGAAGAGARRLFAPMSSVRLLGVAHDAGFLLCLGPDDRPFRWFFPDGPREPLDGEWPGLAKAVAAPVNARDNQFAYVVPVISSRLVLMKNWE